MSEQRDATPHVNAARLAALAGQQAAQKWGPNLVGDFSAVLSHLDAAISALSEIVPLAHTDHPLRHFDRTCDACVAEEVLTVLRDAGFHDAADFLLGKRVNVAAPSATPLIFWAVEGGWSYEGYQLVGVYATEEAAKEAAKKTKGYERTRITRCPIGEAVDVN